MNWRRRVDKCHLDVPFLITTDLINNPILGFKLLMKLFQTSFDQTDVNRIQAFVNPLQMPDKAKGKNTVVPEGCIVEVHWKANIGNLSQTQRLISQQEEKYWRKASNRRTKKSDDNISLIDIPTVEKQHRILSKIDLPELTSEQ